MSSGSDGVEIRFKIDRDKAVKLQKLANELGVDLNTMASNIIDVISSYSGDIALWARTLKVKRHNKPVSIFEELVYYGVEAWRGLVAKILDKLNAKGRYELEELDFDPDEPGFEIEMVALEGSDLKADVIRLHITPRETILEAYYYLEEGEEPPSPKKEIPFEWYYLPDEHAVVIAAKASTVSMLPKIHVVDKVASELMGVH